jgi:hypothetical protein
MNEIFNLGIGLDHRFSGAFSLYCGFTTDRSGYLEEVNTTLTSWDLYHLNLGASFKAFEIDWTLGLGYAWGSDDTRFAFEFADGDGGEGAAGPDGPKTAVEYDRLKVIIGFAFPTPDGKG